MISQSKLHTATEHHCMAQQISHIPKADTKQFLIYDATTHGQQDTKIIFCKIQKEAKKQKCTVPGIITCLDYAGSREREITFLSPHNHWVLVFPLEQNTVDLITEVQKIMSGYRCKFFKPHDNRDQVEILVNYNCKAAQQTRNNTNPIDEEIYPFGIISKRSHRHKKCLNRIDDYLPLISSGKLLKWSEHETT